MSKTATTGKRVFKDGVWRDNDGPITAPPGEWDPPMTDEEITIAALSDPDAQPVSRERLERMKRVSLATHVRWKLGLSREEFGRRFGIPLGTLRDWELHRSEPDAAAESYLKVIAANPNAVAEALQATG